MKTCILSALHGTWLDAPALRYSHPSISVWVAALLSFLQTPPLWRECIQFLVHKAHLHWVRWRPPLWYRLSQIAVGWSSEARLHKETLALLSFFPSTPHDWPKSTSTSEVTLPRQVDSFPFKEEQTAQIKNVFTLKMTRKPSRGAVHHLFSGYLSVP